MGSVSQKRQRPRTGTAPQIEHAFPAAQPKPSSQVFGDNVLGGSALIRAKRAIERVERLRRDVALVIRSAPAALGVRKSLDAHVLSDRADMAGQIRRLTEGARRED